MADIELKPCPFCGFEGVEIISGAFVAVCPCSCGGCGAATAWQDSRESAAAAWNRRAAAAAGTEPAKLAESLYPKCPDCGNTLDNAVPDGSPHLRRCANCKNVWEPASPQRETPELERTCPDCGGIAQPFRACVKCVDRGKIPTEEAVKLALRKGWEIDLQRRLFYDDWNWLSPIWSCSGRFCVEIDHVLVPLNLVDVMRTLGQIDDEAARGTGPDIHQRVQEAMDRQEAREILAEQYEPPPADVACAQPAAPGRCATCRYWGAMRPGNWHSVGGEQFRSCGHPRNATIRTPEDFGCIYYETIPESSKVNHGT